jgi:hypothetical protein
MRCSVLVLLALASCGPGLQSAVERRDAAGTASQTFVKSVAERDVAAIAKLLDPSLAYGGLYFADASCMQRFPTPTVVKPEKHADFAACLATLSLARSERANAMLNVAVYEYAPGIEVEAKFDDRGEGPKLTWIGYSGRRGLFDGLPSIAPSLLEAMRVEGDPKGSPSPEDAAKLAAEYSQTESASAWAWVKICLDNEGAITNVHAREASTPLASKVFAEAAQKWKFKPIVLVGTNPTPACAVVRLSHPPIEGPEVLPLAFKLPDGATHISTQRLRMLAGSKTIVPDDEDKMKIMKAGADGVIGSFMFCFGETGAIDEVRTLDATGLPSYDTKIQRTIATTWKYQPYVFEGKPIRVCTAVTFIYSQK